MSLFQCQLCGVIENTALCHIHRRRAGMKKDDLPAEICSQCTPEIGKWHGKFKREIHPIGSLRTNRLGNVERIDNGEEV